MDTGEFIKIVREFFRGDFIEINVDENYDVEVTNGDRLDYILFTQDGRLIISYGVDIPVRKEFKVSSRSEVLEILRPMKDLFKAKQMIKENLRELGMRD